MQNEYRNGEKRQLEWCARVRDPVNTKTKLRADQDKGIPMVLLPVRGNQDFSEEQEEQKLTSVPARESAPRGYPSVRESVAD
ncbi:unnamed protein product [Toxocara canis]|uniref:Integrase n=1 Tax=Toxocara canis TaxID=6265 RepID=A0A183TVD1_TOXCA|nr:unnamed protein product [Toxocara canis]